METWQAVLILGGAGTAVVIHSAILYKLAAYYEPSRKRIESIGEELLASPELPKGLRSIVHTMARSCRSPWAVPIAIILMPIAVFMALDRERQAAFKKNKIKDENLEFRYEVFDSLYVRSIFAASPLLTLILLAEFIAIGVVVLFVSRIRFYQLRLTALGLDGRFVERHPKLGAFIN